MTMLLSTRRALLRSAGVRYLFRDEFTDTRAAGAVNGTTATPGPGTRTVVDSAGTKLSVAGGFEVIASVTGANDPKINYADVAIARVAGRLMIASWPNVGTGASRGRLNMGFGANNSPYTCTQGWGDRAGAPESCVNGAFVPASGEVLGTPSAVTSENVYLAVVLRATGAFHFAKATLLTGNQWHLIWSNEAEANTPLYPVLSHRTTGAPSLDYIRVPIPRWVPTPLVSDSFDRGNGSLHNSATDGLAVEEAGGAGKVWAAATWTIAGNVALNTPTTGADVIVDGAMTNTVNWTEGANWSIGAGVASIALASSTDIVAAIDPLTANTWYQVVWTNTAIAAGSLRAVLGTNVTATGDAGATYTMTQVANGAAFAMRGVAATASIDNVSCLPLTLSTLFATVPCTTPDVVVELPITEGAGNLGGRQTGIVVNLDNPAAPANFIIAYLNGFGGVQLDEYVAGARTAKIAATAVVYAAGAKLKVIRSGTSCSVFYAETQVGVTQTMTANINTAHGMFSTYPTPTVDNVAIWARGTGGEYNVLETF